MMKHYLLLLLTFSCLTLTAQNQSQSLDALKQARKEKKAARKKLNQQIDSLNKAIQEFPGWKVGFSGVLGVDFTGSRNWFANAIENNDSRAIGGNFSAFANYHKEKFFTKNSLNTALQIQQVENRDIDDSTGEKQPPTELVSTASNFSIASLSGYRYSKNFALSAEGAYETGIVNIDEEERNIVSIFNDPGQLTLSVGASWTPSNNLYFSLHPLGAQWNFPNEDYASSVGAKIRGTYNGKLFNFLGWSSDIRAFIAYEGDEQEGFTAEELTNWNWTNTFTISDLIGGIGLGCTIGLRQNRQLAFNKNIISNADKIQMYYAIGLSYALGG